MLPALSEAMALFIGILYRYLNWNKEKKISNADGTRGKNEDERVKMSKAAKINIRDETKDHKSRRAKKNEIAICFNGNRPIQYEWVFSKCQVLVCKHVHRAID